MRVALVIVLVTGCSLSRQNPLVCCESLADCASIGSEGVEERRCDDPLICVNHVCTAPTCMIDSDCGADLVCSPEQTCVTCLIDETCPAERPRCTEARTCVECLASDDCPATSPVCDLATNACTVCTRDDDCISGVCDTEFGTCLDEEAIVYAAAGGTGTVCTRLAPCAITTAFATANVTRETIKLAPETYTANIVVADKKVVVHGTGATIQAASATPQETILAENRARVRIIGLTIVDPTRQGFSCIAGVDRPIVELDGVTIDSASVSFTAQGCDATIRRSHLSTRANRFKVLAEALSDVSVSQTLIDGVGDGLFALNGAFIRVSNSVIADQTGSNGALLGVGGAVIVSHSTIINSLVLCGNGTGAAVCTGPSPDGACISNTIVLNGLPGAPTNTAPRSKCTFDFSIVTPQSTPVAGANNMLGVDPRLTDPAAGDFHLQPTSAAVDAADPTSSETVDFDGIVRPQGLRNDIGAFERMR